jgi:hypothetical protein
MSGGTGLQFYRSPGILHAKSLVPNTKLATLVSARQMVRAAGSAPILGATQLPVPRRCCIRCTGFKVSTTVPIGIL